MTHLFAIRVRLLLAVTLLAASLAHAQTPVATGAVGGTSFSMIRTSSGALWAVGINSQGQLGDNTTTIRRVPQIVSLPAIVAVVTGGEHTLALTSGGTVYAWGENSYGQVGNGSTTDRKTPLALGLTSVVAIAAGTDHSLALRSTGEVYVWGRNGNGQLGLGTTTNALTPQLLVSDAQAIGAGQSHTLVVKTDGTVWATGLNTNGQLGDGTTTQRTSLVMGTMGVIFASPMTWPMATPYSGPLGATWSPTAHRDRTLCDSCDTVDRSRRKMCGSITWWVTRGSSSPMLRGRSEEMKCSEEAG